VWTGPDGVDFVVRGEGEEYDGTTAVVKTDRVPADEVEFRRWRAERWMKVRHMPSALRAHPRFVPRHWPSLLAHTFRGSTWRSWLGLEDARQTPMTQARSGLADGFAMIAEAS